MDIKILQKNSPVFTGDFIERNPNISYLLSAGSQIKESLLIDANFSLLELKDSLKNTNSVLTGVVLTHAHLDHRADLSKLVKEFPGIKIWVHALSVEKLKAQGYQNVIPLSDNQVIIFGDTKLTILSTPGHTFDSISIWQPEMNILFTGDTIFGGGIGCCDYSLGGNRNVFYRTIGYLLKKLPEQTAVYPGHYSEHYQTAPPFMLSNELNRNPYLKSVFNGLRGDFDCALKQFSIDFELDDHMLLKESDIDRICELEKNTWIPELQASRENILFRLRSGHKMLAVHDKNELLGMVCWRYSGYSIKDTIDKFPRNFNIFSLNVSVEKTAAKSAFIYNLGVKASSRKSGTGSSLLQWVFETIRNDGIDQVFVDSRIPSYQGSNYKKIENVLAAPAFKEAVNRFLFERIEPDQGQLDIDPTLRFYMTNGFRPRLVIDNFIPDRSSGNIRIICYINLEQDEDTDLKTYPRNEV